MTETDFREKEFGSILSEDGTVKFDFMTSLEKIAIAKVATNFLMNQNIQRELVNAFNLRSKCVSIFSEDDFNFAWQKTDLEILDDVSLKCNIVNKVSELCLPDSITKKLIKTIQVLAKFIIGWVQYHNRFILDDRNDSRFILDNRNNSKYSAVDLISHITWTARGKIDLVKTAKNILANQGNSLSDDQKYKIACNCCLEDEIAILAPRIVNEYYLDSIDVDIFPMVYYWTTYVTGDNTKLYNHYIRHTNGMISINEYIILLLLRVEHIGFMALSYKTISVTYMWEKLSEQEKARHVTSLVTLGNLDLQYSVLSNLDYEQQQDIFKKCSGSLLVGILNDWLWEEYFLPVALHILEIMDPKCYEKIFWAILDKMCGMRRYEESNSDLYYQHKYILKKLWQDSPRHLKDYVFGPDGKGYVLFSLSWHRDLDLIDLIFKDVNNAQQKKNIIFSKDGIEDCLSFIENDDWDVLELFIKYTLFSEEDIIELKETLIRDKGIYIVNSCLEYAAYDNAEFDKIERFMMWAFKSEEEMDHFRQSLVREAPLESIYLKNELCFTWIENHFKWCAKGDLGLINKFKSDILESNVDKFIKELIRKDKGQCELLDQVLNWCYLGNRQQIAQFKCNMYKNNLPLVMDIYKMLIEMDNSFKMLDTFIGWFFTNEQQIQEFKTTVLHKYEHFSGVCRYLLERSPSCQLADKFIKWCGISSEVESIFKKELMLHSDIIVSTICEVAYKRYLQLLIKWFNPSEETVQKLKAVLEEEIIRQRITEVQLNTFLKLLDEFIESQNLLVAENKRDVSEDF